MKIELDLSPEVAKFISSCVTMAAFPEGYLPSDDGAKLAIVLVLSARKKVSPLDVQRVMVQIDKIAGIDSTKYLQQLEDRKNSALSSK